MMADIRLQRMKEDEAEFGSASQGSRAKPKRRMTIVERMRLNWQRQEKIEALEIIGNEMVSNEGGNSKQKS